MKTGAGTSATMDGSATDGISGSALCCGTAHPQLLLRVRERGGVLLLPGGIALRNARRSERLEGHGREAGAVIAALGEVRDFLCARSVSVQPFGRTSRAESGR